MKAFFVFLIMSLLAIVSTTFLMASNSFFSYTVPCATYNPGTTDSYTITANDVVVGGGGSIGYFHIASSVSGYGHYWTTVKKNGNQILHRSFDTTWPLSENFTAAAGDVIAITIYRDVPTGEGGEGCTGSGTVILEYQ